MASTALASRQQLSCSCSGSRSQHSQHQHNRLACCSAFQRHQGSNLGQELWQRRRRQARWRQARWQGGGTPALRAALDPSILGDAATSDAAAAAAAGAAAAAAAGATGRGGVPLTTAAALVAFSALVPVMADGLSRLLEPKKCSCCSGAGFTLCAECGARGKVGGIRRGERLEPCAACSGTGRHPCRACRERGFQQGGFLPPLTAYREGEEGGVRSRVLAFLRHPDDGSYSV